MPSQLDNAIAEVKREIALRRNFYAKNIRHGKMGREEANFRIANMEYVLRLLTEKKASEGNEPELPLAGERS